MSITTVAGALKGSPVTYSSGGSDRHAISFKILKEYYTDAITDLLNSRTVLLKYMGRSQRFTVDGQYIVVPLRISRNEGHGHIAEGANLPDPGTQGYERATYLTRNYYGRIKFSGPSAAATKTRRGSFLDIVDSEVTGLVQDMARTMNRVAFGDGSGRLCQIVGTGGATVGPFTVSNPGGFTNLGPGGQYLRPGMRLAVITNAGLTPTIVGIRTLATVSDTQVTFTAALNFPATAHWLVTVSSDASTTAGDLGWINEPEGLASIISDDNPYPSANRWLGQLDRTTYPVWRATVLDNGGVPIDFYQGMLQKLLDEMEKSGDGTAKLFMTTHGIRLAFFDSLQAARRYPNTMKFDGGFETLHYSDRPIVPDRDCTRGRIYGCDFDAIQAFYEEDYHWMEKDGSFLHRMSDQDAYQATLVRYHQFGTDAPNRLGLVADVRDE